jgi:hypothetical protein
MRIKIKIKINFIFNRESKLTKKNKNNVVIRGWNWKEFNLVNRNKKLNNRGSKLTKKNKNNVVIKGWNWKE